MTVEKRMTQNPITIPQETPVPEARQIMQREKIHRLPVVDSKGTLIGIITEKDLLYASPSPASSLDVYEMADITGAMRDSGGNIISLGTFLGDDQTNALCTIKVQGIGREELVRCLEPFVEEVRDIREI